MNHDRREFLRRSAQVALAGGLVGAAGFLAARPERPEASEDCIRQTACGGCALESGCQLPRAMQWRSKLNLARAASGDENV